jgi:hypothetical protein
MHDQTAALGLAFGEIAGFLGERRVARRVGLLCRGTPAQASAPSLSPSNSAIGPVGITVEIACL